MDLKKRCGDETRNVSGTKIPGLTAVRYQKYGVANVDKEG